MQNKDTAVAFRSSCFPFAAANSYHLGQSSIFEVAGYVTISTTAQGTPKSFRLYGKVGLTKSESPEERTVSL
jgi:hypothetical protein